MKINIPRKILSSFSKEKVLIDEPMSRHTSICAGGRASVLLLPETIGELCIIIEELRESKFVIFGNGKNLLIPDRGYNGIIIKTSSIRRIDRFGRYITALTGDTLRDISDKAFEHSLTGMEWAAADDGTLGAAISSNAAHFGAEIRNNIYVVEVINKKGKILSLKENELNMRDLKTDAELKGYTVLRAMLRLEQGSASLTKRHMEVYRKISEIEKGRPSTGEVFSAPAGSGILDVGVLVTECGLAGLIEGGASVSLKNANYIINSGNATTGDVIKLINKIQEDVYNKKGVRLKNNLKLLGKP